MSAFSCLLHSCIHNSLLLFIFFCELSVISQKYIYIYIFPPSTWLRLKLFKAISTEVAKVRGKSGETVKRQLPIKQLTDVTVQRLQVAATALAWRWANHQRLWLTSCPVTFARDGAENDCSLKKKKGQVSGQNVKPKYVAGSSKTQRASFVTAQCWDRN